MPLYDDSLRLNPPSASADGEQGAKDYDDLEQLPKIDVELVKLIREGDVDKLRDVLTWDNIDEYHRSIRQEGSIVSEMTDVLTFTPVWLAVYYGQLNVVKLCIDRGADLKKYGYDYMYPNLKGYSPLALACSRSNCDMPSRYCEIILELIKGGAEVSAEVEYQYAHGVRWPFGKFLSPERLHSYFQPKQYPPYIYWMVQQECSGDFVKALLDSGADPTIYPQLEEAGGLQLKSFDMLHLLVSETLLPDSFIDLYDYLFLGKLTEHTQKLKSLAEIAQDVGYNFPGVMLMFRYEQQQFILNGPPPEDSPWNDYDFSSHLGFEVRNNKPLTRKEIKKAKWLKKLGKGSAYCSECDNSAIDRFVANYNDTSFVQYYYPRVYDLHNAYLTWEAMRKSQLRKFGLCWFRHFMMFSRTVRPLKSICRRKIRECTGGVSMAAKVKSLELPTYLIEYILCKIY